MPKQVIQLSFELAHNGTISLQDVKAMLERATPLGAALSFTEEAEYGEFEPHTVPTKSTWVMVDDQEDVPYHLVSEAGDFDDSNPMEPAILEELLRRGLSVEMFVRYPRASRYGVPELVSTSGAKAFLAEHFPRIATNLSVDCEDSGDDSGTCVWVRLETPV